MLVLDSYQHLNTTHPFDIFGLGQDVWTDQHQEVGDQVGAYVPPFVCRRTCETICSLGIALNLPFLIKYSILFQASNFFIVASLIFNLFKNKT